VLDGEGILLKTALLEVAETGKANFRFTCNQNVILSDIKPEDKSLIEEILQRYGIIEHTEKASVIRGNAMACVALNTCALAMAESQRYLPSLLSKIEPLLSSHGLENEEIIIRMTGCPNGCSRPYNAEIGFVGTALGKYNMHVGGDRYGLRLNTLYKESLNEAQILDELDKMFAAFKEKRIDDETMGDFLHQWLATSVASHRRQPPS
jgi:sulfite reductase (NADPH) hemoprotein beta-component